MINKTSYWKNIALGAATAIALTAGAPKVQAQSLETKIEQTNKDTTRYSPETVANIIKIGYEHKLPAEVIQSQYEKLWKTINK